MSLGNHFSPLLVTPTSLHARRAALVAEIERLKGYLNKYVPNHYFIAALGENERAYIGAEPNPFSDYLRDRNGEITLNLRVAPKYTLYSETGWQADPEFPLRGIAESYFLGDVQVFLTGQPTAPVPLHSMQKEKQIDHLIDQFTAPSPVKEVQGRTSVFRVCASNTLPAQQLHLDPDERHDAIPSIGELCRHLGAAWFSGKSTRFYLTRKMTQR